MKRSLACRTRGDNYRTKGGLEKRIKRDERKSKRLARNLESRKKKRKKENERKKGPKSRRKRIKPFEAGVVRGLIYHHPTSYSTVSKVSPVTFTPRNTRHTPYPEIHVTASSMSPTSHPATIIASSISVSFPDPTFRFADIPHRL